MIDTREQLIHVLTEAAEVEHNLLCAYLYAMFILKRRSERGLGEAQGDAVERWRKLILSVAMEEMAHLACVNNLLLAVGGAPHFNRPNLPAAPGYHPARIVVRLAPFTMATLDHFIFLERPKSEHLRDGAGFAPEAGEREDISGSVTPSAINYETIGKLYDALARGFAALAERLGETVLIDASGRGQLDGTRSGLEGITVVASLAEALEVIERIKEQGEGSSGVIEHSHFDRFQEIKQEWGRFFEADAGFEPAWPAAQNPVMRRPLGEEERVWITDCAAADVLDVGNAIYGAMLGVLTQTYCLESRQPQAALMRLAGAMMQAVGIVGNCLARMPAGPGHDGINAGLTFAVPRNLGYRRQGLRGQLLERFAAIQTKVARLPQDAARDAMQTGLENCRMLAAQLTL